VFKRGGVRRALTGAGGGAGGCGGLGGVGGGAGGAGGEGGGAGGDGGDGKAGRSCAGTQAGKSVDARASSLGNKQCLHERSMCRVACS